MSPSSDARIRRPRLDRRRDAEVGRGLFDDLGELLALDLALGGEASRGGAAMNLVDLLLQLRLEVRVVLDAVDLAFHLGVVLLLQLVELLRHLQLALAGPGLAYGHEGRRVHQRGFVGDVLGAGAGDERRREGHGKGELDELVDHGGLQQ